MKRIFCLLLSLILLNVMAACSQTNNDTGSSHFTNSYSESKSESRQNAQSETTQQPETNETKLEIEPEETNYMMKIEIGDKVFTATLAENSTVDAFKALLADGSLVLNMHDYANMEKGADLGVSLPQNNEPMNTQAGDIILYQDRTFVIYYDTNSWSLTPIGKINNVDAQALRAALGSGDVTVTLSLVQE